MRAAHAEAQTRLTCFFYSQSSCLTKRLLSANDTMLFNYNAAASNSYKFRSSIIHNHGEQNICHIKNGKKGLRISNFSTDLIRMCTSLFSKQ
jgi:hypothetical protein